MIDGTNSAIRVDGLTKFVWFIVSKVFKKYGGHMTRYVGVECHRQCKYYVGDQKVISAWGEVYPYEWWTQIWGGNCWYVKFE